MSCPEEYLLFQLREGGLAQEEEQQVAEHVASCAECQTKLAELEALGKALETPPALTTGEKSALIAGVLSRVDQIDTAPKVTKTPARFWSIALPLTAAACCAVAAIVVVPFFFLAGSSESVALDMGMPMARQEMDEEAEPMAAASQSAPPPAPTGYRGEEGAMGSRDTKRIANRFGVKGPSQGADDILGALGSSRGLGGGGGAPTDSVTLGMPSVQSATKSKMSRGAPRPRSRSGGSSGIISPGRVVAPRPSAIDPNGRFATTYRPGRGHLARFESSMLRGRVPESALALVSDVGRGSRPGLAAPQEQALSVHVDTELGQLPPEGGPMHMAITLRSTNRQPEGRPQMAVHLVMDVSGSMSGAAIEQARQAASSLVTLLQPQDRFSLVAYSSDARVVVEEGPVGPRAAQIQRSIRQIRAGGGTNLEAGLRLGYGQAAAAGQNRDVVQLVLVLSDGRANQGMTDPWGLSEMSAAAFQNGHETTTIGVGDNYDPLVMSTIAEYGAGGYYYLPDASQIEQVLRAELEVRSQPVARGVEVRVTLAPGIELLEAYGSRRLNVLEASRVRATEVAIDQHSSQRDDINQDRQQDRQGGMRFFIPGFARDDQHTILLRLRVPSGNVGAPRQIADLQLRYKDRLLRQNGGDERQIQLGYAHNRAQAQTSENRTVRRMVLTFRTGQALVGLSGRMATGDNGGALATLLERGQLLRAAAAELNDDALGAEADRLDAFRQVLATNSSTNQLMFGSIVQRAGSSFLR